MAAGIRWKGQACCFRVMVRAISSLGLLSWDLASWDVFIIFFFLIAEICMRVGICRKAEISWGKIHSLALNAKNTQGTN